MSKVIRVSNELYAKLEDTAFRNGVGIQHLADQVILAGMTQGKKEAMTVEERGRQVEIKW